jgi:nitrous oxidase accessory protein NosD
VLEIGDGVCLQTTRPDVGGAVVVRRTLVARSGNRFKLDRALRENMWRGQETTVSTLFPLLTAENATDIQIASLALDGNRDDNANLNGNYAGCIWMQDCSRIAIANVTARRYNGDGISWQVCHDVLVENCHCHDNADLGLHPGSGSQRPIVRNNRVERNGIGLFFCWGVKYGLAENNTIADNRDFGVSIGHRDDENVVRDNDILRSGKAGVLFRPERGEGFTGRGNRFEGNRIVDNGGEDGIGVDVQGVTRGNAIVGNVIRETRGPASRIGIRLAPEAEDNRIADNQIEGFATAIARLAKA